jgi:uncharacterized protein
MSASELFLILHGWGGNKPAHWQEHLAAKLIEAGKTVVYPKMPVPTAPNLEDWQACLASTIDEIREKHAGAEVTVLAHSLGCINWIIYTAAHPVDAPIASRVLLVAPPYVVPEIPPIDVPPGVTRFFPPPTAPASLLSACENTVIIASDNDDYATVDQTAGLALKLGVTMHVLHKAGHISPYYGYGEWPWVYSWCVGDADLPPQPKPEA